MDFIRSYFKLYWVVFAFCFLLISFKSYPQDFKEGKILVSGYVKDFDHEKGENTVVFLINSAVNGVIKKTEMIGSRGNFRFETVVPGPLDVSIQYAGKTAELFFRPGDSLKIELGEFPFINIIGGNLAAENGMIQDFLAQRTLGRDYKKPESGSSPLFDAWAADHIKYEVFSKLVQHYNDPSLQGDSISSFLANYDMNRLPVLSVQYSQFLSGLYRYFTHKAEAGRSALFAQYARERNFIGLGGLFSEHIKNKTSGVTRELLLTMLFMDALNGQQLKEFKALWNSDPVLNSYLKSKIIEKSVELERYLENQQIKDGTVLAQVDQAKDESVLDSVVRRFSGKVIYVDFWAPWCSPCMAAMPASSEVQRYYKDKDIVFVFFANRCSEESWKATVANKELRGIHYKLNNDQYNVLASKFNINGIPHYLIINKDGKLVNSNAPGPDQKEDLRSALDRLLK
jgi:thiol-disulfide isomerase/thioredoxin